MKQYFTLFETPLGWMSVAWQNKNLTSMQLPDKREMLVEQNEKHATQKNPPKWVGHIITKIQNHLSGDIQDFSDTPLALDTVTPFQKNVYQSALKIKPGTVVTYGDLAKSIGNPKASRAVGNALGRNPFAPIVPCHRIVAAGKSLGGFSAPGGLSTKTKLLELEGAVLKTNNSWEEAVPLLMKKDKKLAKYIKKIGPLKVEWSESSSTFKSLFRSIVFQQLTGKAATSILNRVIQSFPKRDFPEPKDIMKASENKLRKAGLSQNKVKAVKDLASKTTNGSVPDLAELEKMSNEEIINILTEIRGIGQWSVEMLLIFTLKRMDVLPVSDYGIRKGFALVYGLQELPNPKELAIHGEKWQPYRSIASWYLWRSLDAY